MILASAALLTACDDVFTPAAENMKDINEMENDPIMARGFVLTAYRNLPNYEVGTGTDVATDDAVTNEKGANWSKYATGSWTVQSWDPTGRWNNDLSSMQYLYIFLNSNVSNIGFLKNVNENKLMQRRLTGEAYGLLATHAYYLLRAHAGFDNEGKLLGTQLFDGYVGTDADFNQPRKTYVCEGFFTQEDVDHMKANLDKDDPNFVPNHTFGEIKAGDLKYKDINGDGKIDSNDQQVMGKYGWSATPFFYGVNITLNWKQFTLFIAGTGQMGAKAFKSNDWIYNQKKYTSVVRGRWTPETAATATYPRLTAKDNTNNFRNSNFWLYSTDRFNLNKVQLTYDMPNEWFENKVVKGMSVYVLGESLLTISKNRKYMETSYGSPQCRFYNLGLKMMF